MNTVFTEGQVIAGTAGIILLLMAFAVLFAATMRAAGRNRHVILENHPDEVLHPDKTRHWVGSEVVVEGERDGD